MPSLGKDIHALEKKLQVLADCLFEAGRMPERSRKELADKLGVSYETLKSAWSVGRVSIKLEKKICEIGAFASGELAWNDTDIAPELKSKGRAQYMGRDNIDAFRRMVREKLGLARTLTTRLKGKAAVVVDSNLATFSLSGGQEAKEGARHEVILEGVFGSGIEQNGLEYGFKRVRLRLRMSEDSEAELNRRLGLDAPFDGATWRLTCQGHTHESFWTIASTSPHAALTGEVVTRDKCLCEVADISVGDEIEAELSIRPFDGSVTRTDGAPIANKALRSILERLHAEKIGATDTQGWITLGRQTLCLVRADR